MSFVGEMTTKKRKVVFDEHSGGFYSESRVEALKRQIDYRARLTDVINKSEEAKYRFAVKQVDAEKHIFLMKKDREATRHNESLLDHKAHLSVLDKLAKKREESSADDIYGRYPPDSTRLHLESMVEIERKEMSPVAIRKREATKLLRMRTDLGVIDRTLSTEDVFGEFHNRRSRLPSPVKAVPEVTSMTSTKKELPKLVLPAITVKMTKSGDRPKVTDSVTQSQSLKNSKAPEKRELSSSDLLPSVFVTQMKDTNRPR